MKIIVAINNEKLKSQIDKIYSNNVYKYDIDDMEGVIEYLSKNKSNENRVLITKDNLEGNINNIEYIKQIRQTDSNIKVILFVNNLNKEYKEFLFANEVFDIIESNIITIDQIKECIESDKLVIYKNNNITNEINENIQEKQNYISKKVISIYGANGAGKSYISSILAHDICNKTKRNTILLDMDIQSSSIDIYNDLNYATNALTKVIDDIDKKKNINDCIKNNIICDIKENKLSYLTNNCSLYECQNKFSEKYYQKIYNECKNIYDYVVIDLPSSPFIDSVKYSLIFSDLIVFVINPNYLSLRQAIKYIEFANKLCDISKEKIVIMVNKLQKDSLDNMQIQSILAGYEIIANANFDYFVEGYINGASTHINSNIDFSKLYKKLNIEINHIKNQSSSKKIIFSQLIEKIHEKHEETT